MWFVFTRERHHSLSRPESTFSLRCSGSQVIRRTKLGSIRKEPTEYRTLVSLDDGAFKNRLLTYKAHLLVLRSLFHFGCRNHSTSIVRNGPEPKVLGAFMPRKKSSHRSKQSKEGLWAQVSPAPGAFARTAPRDLGKWFCWGGRCAAREA